MMTRTKLYELTDEHRVQLKPWADRWIANAMSTAAMTDEDRRVSADAAVRLYAAAGLQAPRVVFVPSPFVGAFAAGFAAAIWHNRKEGRAATEAATWAATWAATRDAWYTFPLAAMQEMDRSFGLGGFGLQCAAYTSWRMRQGGNQWSASDAFCSFFRHVAKLPIDYTHWDAWETLSLHSGPRWLHPEFCIISDRPELLTIDEQNRPHSDAGPFCRWRDGSALYAVRGHHTPAWIVERPDLLTTEKIEAENNAETRRIMIERFPGGGVAAYLRAANAERLDVDEAHGTLWRKERPDDSPILMVQVTNNTVEPDGTIREFFLRVHPELRPMHSDGTLGRPQRMTARNAVASTWGLRGEEFAPEART